MPVTIRYAGRFGNNLFQYAAARLFAERHDLALLTPWPRQTYLACNQVAPGGTKREYKPVATTAPTIINDANMDDWTNRSEVQDGHYRFEGYFQVAAFYEGHRDRIMDWFGLDDLVCAQDGSLGLHVRATDHGHCAWGSQVIAPSWYIGILENTSFDTLNVFTDDMFDGSYYGAFDRWKDRLVVHNEPNCMEEFNRMRRMKRFILPNSSFSWWAIFLGCAAKVWQWKRGMELPYVRYALSWAEQVDGKYLREAQG